MIAYVVTVGLSLGRFGMHDLIPRAARPEELDYVKNSWVKSYEDSPWGQSLPREIFRRGHSALVEALVPISTVLVVPSAEDDTTILGWLAAKGSTLHYVYVRAKVRRMGIAKLLVQAYKPEIEKYSHPTRIRTPWQWDPYEIGRL